MYKIIMFLFFTLFTIPAFACDIHTQPMQLFPPDMQGIQQVRVECNTTQQVELYPEKTFMVNQHGQRLPLIFIDRNTGEVITGENPAITLSGQPIDIIVKVAKQHIQSGNYQAQVVWVVNH